MTSKTRRLFERLQLLTPVGPAPTGDDVEHYLRLREALGGVYGGIIEGLPRRAVCDIAAALDLSEGELPDIPAEGMIDPHVDCGMFGWIDGGRNMVQKYAEDCPPPRDPDEREVLAAMLRARYAVLGVEMQLPGRGVRAVDMVTGERVSVIDIALSLWPGTERAVLAGHILPIGEHWMLTGGNVGLEKSDARRLLRSLNPGDRAGMGELLKQPETMFAVLKWCRREIPDQAILRINIPEILRGGFEPVDAHEIDVFEPEILAVPRPPSRNAPGPCGSGRRYKRCCGRERRARRTA
jgi:hypothetical protein